VFSFLFFNRFEIYLLSRLSPAALENKLMWCAMLKFYHHVLNWRNVWREPNAAGWYTRLIFSIFFSWV